MKRFVVLAAALACLTSPGVAQEQAPAPAPAPAPAYQEFCGVLTHTGDSSSYVPAPGYTVLGATLPLAPPRVAASNIDALVCVRSSIYIGPHDHRVLTDLRVPLFIRDTNRMAVLEIAGDQLRVRFTQGQPTPEEAQALGAAIDRAHDAMASAG